MIMHIFQVTIRPGKEAVFAKFFHDTAIPLMKGTEDIVYVYPGTVRAESPNEFAFVMIWRDLDALKGFVCEDCTTRHIDPAEDDLVAA